MATEAQIQDLGDAIKANGQTTPITVTEDGVLLDGRARLKACEIAGIEPRFTTYQGTDPVSVILNHNPRHHRLSQNRKALIAARERLAFKDRFNAFTRIHRDKAAWEADRAAHSLTVLARTHGVSTARISMATTVWKHAPHLVDAIRKGTTSMDTAYKTAKDTKTAIKAYLADPHPQRAETHASPAPKPTPTPTSHKTSRSTPPESQQHC